MKTRDYRLDKAKGILIFIVVLGHFLEQIDGWEMGYSRALLTSIYSFHMPAFVLLAGITAKSNRLLDRVLVFLVLVITAQPVYYFWIDLFGKPPGLELDEPYWITWFLLAMVWWLLLLPLVDRFPVPMLVVSIMIGVLGGTLPMLDYELSIGRTLTFFPFFVIGKLFGMRLLQWAAELNIAQKLSLTICAVVPMAALYMQDLDHRWFYGARGFEYLDEAIPYGVGMRVLIGASAVLSIVVLFCWAEKLPSFLIPAGQHSLAIFLLHGLVVRALDEPLNEMLDKTPGSVSVIVCLVLAGMVTLLFSWSRFDGAIRWYSSGIAGLVSKLLSRMAPERRSARH